MDLKQSCTAAFCLGNKSGQVCDPKSGVSEQDSSCIQSRHPPHVSCDLSESKMPGIGRRIVQLFSNVGLRAAKSIVRSLTVHSG